VVSTKVHPTILSTVQHMWVISWMVVEGPNRFVAFERLWLLFLEVSLYSGLLPLVRLDILFFRRGLALYFVSAKKLDLALWYMLFSSTIRIQDSRFSYQPRLAGWTKIHTKVSAWSHQWVQPKSQPPNCDGHVRWAQYRPIALRALSPGQHDSFWSRY